jgi:hypothetical protein
MLPMLGGVYTQAVEFWSTLCDIETELEEDDDPAEVSQGFCLPGTVCLTTWAAAVLIQQLTVLLTTAAASIPAVTGRFGGCPRKHAQASHFAQKPLPCLSLTNVIADRRPLCAAAAAAAVGCVVLTQPNHNFIKAVTPHLVPVLLKQLTKQEEGQEQDDTAWNMAMAAGTCLGLLARTAQVG